MDDRSRSVAWHAFRARTHLPAAVLMIMALALMATSPSPRAAITDEASTDFRLAADEELVVTLVATLNEDAFLEPFWQEPSLSIDVDAGPGGDTEPQLEAELRAMDPDGTVFGRPVSTLESGHLRLLQFCGNQPGCEQHFQVVVRRRGGGPEVAGSVGVRAEAEYEGDRGDEPPGAAFDVRFLAASAEIRTAPPAPVDEPLVVEVVDGDGNVARPQQVSVTRVGDGQAPVLVRGRAEDSITVELRAGDDPMGDDRMTLDLRHGGRVLCGREEPCPSEFTVDVASIYTEGKPRRAAVELFSSADWLVERGGTSIPVIGPAYREHVEGVVELTATEPIVDLGHAVTIGTNDQQPPDNAQQAAEDVDLGAVLEVAASPLTKGGRVRVTMGPQHFERTLTGDRREVAVSTWLSGAFDGGQFRAPLPATVELVGDEPVRITWRLEVGMDPVLWELPPGPPLGLSPTGAR